MRCCLLIDFGSTYTKVTAVDLETENIIGTAKAFTTIQTDINDGLSAALDELYLKTGKLDFVNRFACSSAAGGLKMIAVGLVPELTAEAAKRAALSAGAKVLKVYSYELNRSEASEIQNSKPDIILLTGGTNGGNKDVILHNAGVIAGIEGNFPVIVAGNKSAVDGVSQILKAAGKEVRICENVMPEYNILNIEPARSTIRDLFLERIILAKGLTKIGDLVEGIVMPTPSAVLEAAKLLANGGGGEAGIGDLIVVDVGGATTDVHSVASGAPTRPGVLLKGLPEPHVKRTVEGDLGARYSSLALVESVGVENAAVASGLDTDEFMSYIKMFETNPDVLPGTDEKIRQVDFALASIAVKHAMERHSGSIETCYTPLGVVYVQTGKDLTGIKRIIGTGGPVINGKDPKEILKNALFDDTNPAVLKPVDSEFMLDAKYILAAMGLLGERYPAVALRILKKELQKLL